MKGKVNDFVKIPNHETSLLCLCCSVFGIDCEMVRVWFPNLYMRLVGLNLKSSTGKALFYVPPKMTKFEVEEYLSKIYNVQVINVNTELKLGKWKRFFGKRRVVSYKRRNYKKAYVDFVNPEVASE